MLHQILMETKINLKSIVERVEIIDIAEEGKGVGKVDGLVLFVDHAVPGDVVDVLVHKKKKNLAQGSIHFIHKRSANRSEPFCKHFGICGGCKWQHIKYEAQLELKQKSVCDALERIGKIDTKICEPILQSANNRFYRNKLEFTFSNKAWLTKQHLESLPREQELRGSSGSTAGATPSLPALGFHIPGRFDKILDIEECHLQSDPSNEMRNALRHFALEHAYTFYDLKNHTGELRNLIIRTSSTHEVMVALVFAHVSEDRITLIMDFLKNRFSNIHSLLYIVNQKKNDTIFDQEINLYSGRDYIFEEMPDADGKSTLKFKIGIKSFYQTNSLQAYELYKIVSNFADLKGNELVYDLYTGAGTIANFIAHRAKRVIGIDCVPTAIQDAILNSNDNGITNTQFYAGDMKDLLNTNFVMEHGKPDVIIVDPPRAGMHPDVVQCLLDIAANKIVYVSCNAATQARDLSLLTQKYHIKRIKPVDMFPHTQHVENVVLLQLL